MLRQIGMEHVLRTSQFIRMFSRKERMLISESHWKTEQESYIKTLQDFTHVLEQMDWNESYSKLTVFLIDCLSKEILRIVQNFDQIPKEELLEQLELTISLVYGVFLSFNGNHLAMISRFPMKEEEMSWYFKGFLEENELEERFIQLSA